MQVKLLKDLEPRMALLRALLKQYELNSFYVDFKRMEYKYKKEIKKNNKNKNAENGSAECNSPRTKHVPEICFSELCSSDQSSGSGSSSHETARLAADAKEENETAAQKPNPKIVKKGKSLKQANRNVSTPLSPSSDKKPPFFQINYDEKEENEEVKAVFNRRKNSQKKRDK